MNPYILFRKVKDLTNAGSFLQKRWDEPTYMTFKVLFGRNSINFNGTTLENTNYDRMPHPLFINQQTDSNLLNIGNRSVLMFGRSEYSTIDYLRDSNEFTRAEMLKSFITLWDELQTEFQWYFQSIDGVKDLLNIMPEKGKRVGHDVRLTFNMLEGIDHRISHLLNLYRKIAWDDNYQRWVLPDMMRYFDIQIYITEFRTFHQSEIAMAREAILNDRDLTFGVSVVGSQNEPVNLQLIQRIGGAFNSVLPTYMIQCEMCEFDINSFDFSYRNRLSVADSPEAATISFKVKVGNINEITTYPLFEHFLFNDYKINGLDRSREKGILKDKNGRIINNLDPETGQPVESDYSSTKNGDARYVLQDMVAQETFMQNDHISGTPYIELSNKNVLFGEAGKFGYLSQSRNGQEYTQVDPMNPETWVGNALQWGKSFTINYAKQKLDKAKMVKIPGLGVSFTEALSAIQSKDFLQVFSLIRRAISQAADDGRKSATENPIIDTTFRQFLTGIATSEATDDDQLELIASAKQILSNRGTWETVKDLSYATNLVGSGETNIPVIIQGAGEYKNQSELLSGNDRSKATDLDGGPDPIIRKVGNIMEMTPSSKLSKQIEGPKIELPNPSKATTSNI